MAQLIRPVAGEKSDIIATELVERFGTLAAVIAAPSSALNGVLGDAPAVRRHLKLLRRADLHMKRLPALRGPVLGNWQALLDYLHVAQAFSPVEEIRVLFLNSRNILLREEVMWRGSVDQAPLYVREIIRRSLELGAVAIVVVHNHPSGDPKPSRADVEITRLLVDAGKKLGVMVHDHLVLAPSGHTSLKALGLL